MNLSLNAFIKLFALDMPKQMAEVSRRVQQPSGGYDFYRSLYLAIKAFVDGKTQDEIDFILNSPINPAEVNLNKLAYDSFIVKFGKKKKSLRMFDRKRNFELEDGNLSIVVAPCFMMESPNGIEVFHIWATQNPPVNRHMAALGCYICKEAFRRTSASNYTFKFFDTVGGRVYSSYFNNTSQLINQTAKNVIHWSNLSR